MSPLPSLSRCCNALSSLKCSLDASKSQVLATFLRSPPSSQHSPRCPQVKSPPPCSSTATPPRPPQPPRSLPVPGLSKRRHLRPVTRPENQHANPRRVSFRNTSRSNLTAPPHHLLPQRQPPACSSFLLNLTPNSHNSRGELLKSSTGSQPLPPPILSPWASLHLG